MTLRLDAALGFLFTELPFEARFAAAARAGFRAVEYAFPYAHDPARLRALLETEGLEQVCMLAPAGDWAAGERGIAALLGREAAFREGMRRAVDYAAALRCRVVHVAAGLLPADADPARCRALFLEHLAFAADLARPCGVTVAIEPVCRHDFPAFLFHTVAEALAILDAVARPNTGLILDTWHTGTEEGDLLGPFALAAPRCVHLQLGDSPGRGEPGSGALDITGFLRAVLASGYRGWIGCEYRPSRCDSMAALGWARAAGLLDKTGREATT